MRSTQTVKGLSFVHRGNEGLHTEVCDEACVLGRLGVLDDETFS